MAHLHQELLLDLNADTTEFCHLLNYTQYLAVGTYQLQENRTDRIGKVFLYQLNQPGTSLDLLHTISTSGIFDMKWTSGAHSAPVLGLALASGRLQVLDLAVLKEVWSCDVDTDALLSSLAWNPHSDRMQAAVSSSAGGVAIVQANEAEAAALQQWQGHDLEAWVVEWDRHKVDVVYSGGDDCAFKGWDVRQLDTGEAPALFANRKAHQAGVCCISSHPQLEHVLVTGSYDESIRCWDVRNVSRPVSSSEVNTGGGVWRLRWHPRDPTILLAACMYNGFAIVRCDEGGSKLEVVERYSSPCESIAYGASWFYGEPEGRRGPSAVGDEQGPHAGGGGLAGSDELGPEGGLQKGLQAGSCEGCEETAARGARKDRVATCSFYDNRLHLWAPGYDL